MFIHSFLRPVLLLAAVPLVSCEGNTWAGSLAFVQQYDWDHNAVWPVGTKQTIGWTTNFTDYYISLWQHDIEIFGTKQRDIGRIFNSTSIAGDASGPQTFTWDVTLDLNTPASPPNLLSSPVFFLWLFEITGDGSTGGQFGSYAFNITQDASTATTSYGTTTSTPMPTAISSGAYGLDSASTSSSTSTLSSASISSNASPLSSATTLSSAFTSSSTSTPTTSDTSSPAIASPSHQSMALALKIGLGVGLGLGIPLLLIVGGLIGWRAFGRRRRSPASGDPYVLSTRQSPNFPPGYQDSKHYKAFYDSDVALQPQNVANDRTGYGDVHEMNAHRPPAELSTGDR